MTQVCNGLRPEISECSIEMKNLLAACWDPDPSSRPCLFFIPFFMTLCFIFFFTFDFFNVYQHSVSLSQLSITFNNPFLALSSKMMHPFSIHSFHFLAFFNNHEIHFIVAPHFSQCKESCSTFSSSLVKTIRITNEVWDRGVH